MVKLNKKKNSFSLCTEQHAIELLLNVDRNEIKV